MLLKHGFAPRCLFLNVKHRHKIAADIFDLFEGRSLSSQTSCPLRSNIEVSQLTFHVSISHRSLFHIFTLWHYGVNAVYLSTYADGCRLLVYGNNSVYLSTYEDGCRLLVYGINALSPASIAHVLPLAVPGVPCAEERNPRSGRRPAKVTPEQVAKVMQSTFTR